MRFVHQSILTITFSAFFTSAIAQSTSNAQSHPTMPPEVITACNNKKEKDECTITTPKNETIEGTCHKLPHAANELACLPKPPKEIVDACKDKKDGDSCSFATPRGNKISGTCHQSPIEEKEQLCIPAAPVSGRSENTK